MLARIQTQRAIRLTSPSVPSSIPFTSRSARSRIMAARQFGEQKPIKKGFIVLVTGQLGAGQIDKFKEVFAPLAAHVAQNEDGCYAYELSTNVDNPDKIVIYERYKDKAYVEQVHWQSAPFKAFQEGLKAAGIEWVEKNVVTYEEADIGF